MSGQALLGTDNVAERHHGEDEIGATYLGDTRIFGRLQVFVNRVTEDAADVRVTEDGLFRRILE